MPRPKGHTARTVVESETEDVTESDEYESSEYQEDTDSKETEYSDESEYDNDGSESGNSESSDSEYNETDFSEEYTDENETAESDPPIIYQCEDLSITAYSKYWMYVLTAEQWGHLIERIDEGQFYLSSYADHDIRIGDIVLIYQRPDKAPGGVVGICETSTPMTKNDGTMNLTKKNSSGMIKVFRDMNMNRYVMRLSTISLFDEPYKLYGLKSIIDNLDTHYTSMQQFIRKHIKGECNFVWIDDDNLALTLIKAMNDATSLLHGMHTQPGEEGSQDGDTGDEVSRDEDGEDSEDGAEFSDSEERPSDAYDDCGSEQTTNPYISESDEESLNNFSEGSVHFSPIAQYHALPNIPIMFVPCSSLPRELRKFKRDKNIIKMIYHHYLHCRKCDITNNNSTELSDAVAVLGLHNVEFVKSECEDLIEAYMDDVTYPRPKRTKKDEESADGGNGGNGEGTADTVGDGDTAQSIEIPEDVEEKIVFHYVINNETYADCVVIEYTTRCMKVVEADKAIDCSKRQQRERKVEQKRTKRQSPNTLTIFSKADKLVKSKKTKQNGSTKPFPTIKLRLKKKA